MEKNKKDKKTLIIELTDETEKELKVYMEEITRLLNEEKPPECINKNSCKKTDSSKRKGSILYRCSNR